MSLNIPDGPRLWNRPVPPPKVTAYGGAQVNLEVRASVSGWHYGYAWFTGEHVTRTEKLDLVWHTSDYTNMEHLHKGDLGSVRIGRLSLDNNHYGGFNFYVHEVSERLKPFAKCGSEGLRMRVELRAQGVEESWIHHYHIRKTGPGRVEIVEVEG